MTIGGISILLGYRLFLKIPERDSDGKIALPWDITVIMSRVGSGVFFALFGAAVVAFSLHKGIEVSEQKSATVGGARHSAPATGAAGESRELKWGAAPTPAVEKAERTDARALLRRDIAILNNITYALRPDLPEHERTPIELAIPRIKFALMKPLWGDTGEGWGAPPEFEQWLRAGMWDKARSLPSRSRFPSRSCSIGAAIGWTVRYSFGLGIGAIAGQATGDTLNFAWSWANNYGRGVFEASRDGSAFSGTWGYRESADNAGTWNGQRAN